MNGKMELYNILKIGRFSKKNRSQILMDFFCILGYVFFVSFCEKAHSFELKIFFYLKQYTSPTDISSVGDGGGRIRQNHIYGKTFV